MSAVNSFEEIQFIEFLGRYASLYRLSDLWTSICSCSERDICESFIISDIYITRV